MSLLPQTTVRAVVLDEMRRATAWAARQGLDLQFDEQRLALEMSLTGPTANGRGSEEYLLKATFEDYRALPPSWWFAHPQTGEDVGPPGYPASPNPHPRQTAMFIQGGPSGAVICAHFNRLAYVERLDDGKQRDAPHPNWGEPGNWLNVPNDPNEARYARAETIPDMLARIQLEVNDSSGRMEPLR